jgi:hypothetical protein
MLWMQCGEGGVGLEGTLGFVEVVGVAADAAAVVAGAAVAAVAEHQGGRRRRAPRLGLVGTPAMWVVAGIVVGLAD